VVSAVPSIIEMITAPCAVRALRAFERLRAQKKEEQGGLTATAAGPAAWCYQARANCRPPTSWRRPGTPH